MLYTHSTLDRADHLRRDAAALKRLRQQRSTRLLPVWQGQILVTDGDPAAPPALASLAFDAEPGDSAPVWLGLVGDVAYFAVACGSASDTDGQRIAALATTPDGRPLAARFAELRQVGALLPADEAALLALARGLVYWHETTRFCARCGGCLHSSHGGHVLVCGTNSCAHHEFPRTDPAVIMLVTSPPPAAGDPLAAHRSAAVPDSDARTDEGERCLLGRSPGWPEGVYSTLAGFVEPGESLEQAVQREVFEEAGIRTTAVSYVASQPWPFPRSIMLGFEAQALDSELRIDRTELADAAWFSREELRRFGTWGDQRYARQLPRTDSIARFLIERWLRAGSVV